MTVYELGFPNQEVERSFLEDLVGAYVGLEKIAANAIAQIREKKYAAPFALSQKRITLVGLGFSSEKRTVTDSAFEAL